MLCGYYAFEGGNTEYARSNLILLSKDKRSDGLLSICSPCGIDLTIPSFSLYYFIAVGEYLKYTKDATLIDEIYTKLISLPETFVGNMHNGLVYKFTGENHWNFYDWSEYLEGKLFADEEYKPDLIINCFFVMKILPGIFAYGLRNRFRTGLFLPLKRGSILYLFCRIIR